jgi:hypothetical protein
MTSRIYHSDPSSDSAPGDDELGTPDYAGPAEL